MRVDQIAYAVIFALPFLLLILDWYIDTEWTERAVKYIKWPWTLFTLAWVVWQHDWSALTILVWLGLAMFLQPALKAMHRR